MKYGVLFLLLVPHILYAQVRVADLGLSEDSRGAIEAVVCSLNLNNFGDYKTVKLRTRIDPESYAEKRKSIVKRIIAAGCDIIAVQEVLGKSVIDAEEALKSLARLLLHATNRIFDFRAGPSNDSRAHIGFLVATDRARILSRVSYVNVELPKVSKDQKPRLFSRGPLELKLEVFPRGDTFSKRVTLINFHFKSKSTKGGTDPSGLDFEPYRMEMSEALRKIIEIRHKESLQSGKGILLALGDRNSHSDTASARILEGTLTLSDFKGSGPCRLNSRGVPLCRPGTASAQELFSVFTTNPLTKSLQGTIRYKGVYSWIDDILMPAESLAFAWKEPGKEGVYNSGVTYEPEDASDHALVWVALNW